MGHGIRGRTYRPINPNIFYGHDNGHMLFTGF